MILNVLHVVTGGYGSYNQVLTVHRQEADGVQTHVCLMPEHQVFLTLYNAAALLEFWASTKK